MTRGKYAAKANGQRAEVAQNTAAQLRMQIAEMRREHAVEIAALKAQVDQLNGKLLRDVDQLAAARIEQERSSAQQAIERERTRLREAYVEVRSMLREGGAVLAEREWVRIAEIFGVQVGDGLPDGNRNARRVTAKDSRRLTENISREQARQTLVGGLIAKTSRSVGHDEVLSYADKVQL